MTTKKDAIVSIDESLSSDQVLQYLTDPDSVQIQMFQEAPEEVRARIEAQLLGAQSLDELLGERAVLSAKSMVNKPFTVRSVSWRQSDIEGEGLPFYAVCDVALPDGTLEALSCGARSVVQKLAIMDARGWLPASVRIVEGKTTPAGYKPLDLVAAPDGF